MKNKQLRIINNAQKEWGRVLDKKVDLFLEVKSDPELDSLEKRLRLELVDKIEDYCFKEEVKNSLF